MPIQCPRLEVTAEQSAEFGARFWSKVDIGAPGDCWMWLAGCSERGYGRFKLPGRNGLVMKAPRMAYALSVGPIPEGLVIDHLCSTPRCVNPAHLELVSPAENIRRAYRHITHCPQGHEYTPENTYRPQGRRRCKACHVERERERHRRARVRRAAA